MSNGRANFVVLESGAAAAKQYCEEGLVPHERKFHGAVGNGIIFMDDNARLQRAFCVQDKLQSGGIDHMQWPVYSTNLNTIEHAWDYLGRSIAARNRPPSLKKDFRRMLKQEWHNIPQEHLDTIIESIHIAQP